jgi:hypothetical protein
MSNRWTALALVFVTRTSMGVQFQSIAAVAPLMRQALALSYAQVGTLIGSTCCPALSLRCPTA